MMRDKKVFQQGFQIAYEFAPQNYNPQATDWTNFNYMCTQHFGFEMYKDVKIVGIDSIMMSGDTTGTFTGNNVTNFTAEFALISQSGLGFGNPSAKVVGAGSTGLAELHAISYGVRSFVVDNYSNNRDLRHLDLVGSGFKPLSVTANLDPRNSLSGSLPTVLELHMNIHFVEIENK